MPLKGTPTIEINGSETPFTIRTHPPIRVMEPLRPSSMELTPQNRCIYCGATDNLTNEHIIPFGLSGEHILPKASCKECAKQTGKMEQELLRGPMRAARILRQLRSRTNHSDSPKTHRLHYVKDGGKHSIDLPIEDYPVLLHFPIFAQPGYLTGKLTTGIDLKGMHTVLFGKNPNEVAKTLGASEIVLPSSREAPFAFARLVAKIGYGFAVASGEILKIQGKSPIPKYILGQEKDIGHWVFTDDTEIIVTPNALHRIQLHEMHDLLIAEVQLFADSQTPRYGVILGQLREK